MRENDHEDASFLGGVRWSLDGAGVTNATWPLARLTLTPEGVRLTPAHSLVRILMPGLIPSWSIPWQDLLRAERVRGTATASPGIRFFVRGADSPFVFWCYRPQDVLEALERAGVPVDRDVHRVSLMGL